MGAWLLGTVGFVLYFLYDINSLKWNNRFFHCFFGVGTLVLCVSAVWSLSGVSFFSSTGLPLRILCGAGAILFLILLIYTLFFALPFDETYVKENQGRKVYTEGMYALCRHPGVLWFAGLFLCLWGVTGDIHRWPYFVTMIVWDYIYVIFQDIWTFPGTFTDYEEYKRKAPFLLPDRRSIRAALRGREKNDRKEGGQR